MKTLIDATTAGGSTTAIDITADNPKTFIANGLDGAEEATIQISYDGTNFQDLYYDGSKVALTATNNALKTDAPGKYKVVLDATASAASVSIDSKFD